MLIPDSLPTKYYLGHAYELFSFVSRECASLLDHHHREYLSGISSLGENAQCLLIRCLTRKPRFIKLASLRYAEIEFLENALSTLIEAKYLRSPNAHDWPELTHELTRAQLIESLEQESIKVKSSTPKAELVRHAKKYLNGQEPHLSSLLQGFIIRRQTDAIDYIFFLFFGDIQNRFQKFAMRDLGVMKTQRGTKKVARFNNLDEAQSAFKLQKYRRDFNVNPAELKEETADYLIQNPAVGFNAQETHNRLVLSVGNELVEHDPEKAITLWKVSDEPQAVEKWVRETYKRFDRKKLKKTLLEMKDANLVPSTKVFIEDFYARKYLGKRTSLYTDMLREKATNLIIDEAFINDVEDGVIAYHRAQGKDALFAENGFWRGLFALTFWDLLYGSEQHQFSEFEQLPIQLRNNTFYSLQSAEINQCLQGFNSPSALLTKLTQRSVAHYGKPNGLFHWHPGLIETLRFALMASNATSLAHVLKCMSKNYANTKDGYPDLMIMEKNQLRFEEVKAPGDVLRPNQLLSINRLRTAGLRVDVSQVTWASNPRQVYAVVDIETTGSRKVGNSITEIAVVKVRNNEIISEWSTLINPRSHIPAYITRLTGIDNALVASAPVFAEIADELKAQLEGAIFVAHNVGFDYGFIKVAYNAIGRSFKMPKFCTVSNSRKTFPGLKSYSLGALTKHFDIELLSHHRALSDAKATADLLRLIQDTRIQQRSAQTNTG